MNNRGAPGLRKLCIFQSAMKRMNLGVYPESDPENSLSQPIYCYMSISHTRHKKFNN